MEAHPTLKSLTFEVVGDRRLHCESCELRVKRLLKRMAGVGDVRADSGQQRIEVLFDSATLDAAAITGRLATAGYDARILDTAGPKA